MTVFRKPQVALPPKAAPFAIRAERAADGAAREALLDASFGENRHGRTCQRLRDAARAAAALPRAPLPPPPLGDNPHGRPPQRLRDGRAPAAGLALAAVHEGQFVGTVRLW